MLYHPGEDFLKRVFTHMPIETTYNGHRFRSRLEARWAAFFDSLHARWQYEPEGYDFGYGLKYVPDFWLPEIDLFVEIKPQAFQPDNDCLRKLALLSDATNARTTLMTGDPLDCLPDICVTKYRQWDDFGFDIFFGDGGDNPYRWCVCPVCEKLGFEYFGWSDRVCGDTKTCERIYESRGLRFNKLDTSRSKILYAAANSVRAMRFDVTGNQAIKSWMT